MRFPSVRRWSGWFARSFCLLLPLLAGCGDYCLFCDGQGGGGGGGGSTTEICDTAFSGLAAYQAALNLQVITRFEAQRQRDDRLSLAVLPKGMSFDYGSNRTADAGDVILADQQATDVYVYEYESKTAQTQRLLGVDVGHVSGVTLLHHEIDPTNAIFADLLLFTVETEDTLYIYDLTGTTLPSTLDNPYPITNSDTAGFFSGGDFFQSPTAIAVRADANEAFVFVLNDNLNLDTNVNDSSVRRLKVNLEDWQLASARTVATLTGSDQRLVDLSFYDQTDTLYVSKKTVAQTLNNGWVYKIANASDSTSSANLNAESTFIAGGGAPTGLTAAFTNKTGTTADLLVLTEGDGQVLQYNIDSGSGPRAALPLEGISLYPQAIEYDCTNVRLLMVDIPVNPDLPTGVRTFFEAFPSQ